MRVLAVAYVALAVCSSIAVLTFANIGELVLARDLPALMFGDLDPISKLASFLLLGLLVTALVNAAQRRSPGAAGNLRMLALISPLPGILSGAIQAVGILTVAQRLNASIEVAAPSIASAIVIVAYGFAVGAVAAVLHEHVRAKSSANSFI